MNFNLTPKQIVIAVVLIVLGTLFFFYNLGLLNFSFNPGIIWKIWPLVLILVGVGYFIKDEKIKSGVFIIVAILAGLTIFSAVTVVVNHFWPRDAREKKVATYTKSIKKANFVFKASTGEFVLKDTSKDLVEIKTDLNYGDYTLDKKVDGESANVHLEMIRSSFPLNPFKAKNSLEVKLNSAPFWDIDADISAGTLNFDLSKFKVQNALIASKASTVSIKLGDINDLTKIKLNTDASKVTLTIPATVGARIDGDYALTTHEFSGFEQKEGAYKTDNFDQVSKRIYIELDAGVSTLKIERY